MADSEVHTVLENKIVKEEYEEFTEEESSMFDFTALGY
jgi:hypothetical protein